MIKRRLFICAFYRKVFNITGHNLSLPLSGKYGGHFIKREPGDVFELPDADHWWMELFRFLEHMGTIENFCKFLMDLKIREPLEMKKPKSAEEKMPGGHPYYLMLMQFTLSWKDPKYKYRWVRSLQKGYDHFLNDLETQGFTHFIKIDKHDISFKGIEGLLYWDSLKGFLKSIQYKGFLKLFYKIDHLKRMLRIEELISHMKSYPSLENLDHTLFPNSL